MNLAENGKDLQYAYECGARSNIPLSCSQWYTDITSEETESGSVSSLAEHSVVCYPGAVLQMFKYETVDDEVRYSYHCCQKANIPTPMPTAEPTLLPSMAPSLEPTLEPTLQPQAHRTEAPVASTEPTPKPSFAPLVARTDTPIAEATVAPSF